MGFVIIVPFSKKFQIKSSTQGVAQQCWQELEILQFKGTGDFMPFIEQAKYYFNDAVKSHWRTGALLYYYSLMNLAKAYLIITSKHTSAELISRKVLHGISAKPDSARNLVDFEVNIANPSTAGNIQLFPELYEAVTGSRWSFTSPVAMKVADILPYCADIGDEVSRLYGIENVLGLVKSLIRTTGSPPKSAWFEAVTDPKTAPRMASLQGWKLDILNLERLTIDDKNDWLLSVRETAASLRNQAILRGETFSNEKDGTSIMEQAKRDAIAKLQECAQPVVYWEDNSPGWYFVPKITIQGTAMLWHPMLSDYVVSFALSTIVRYAPHLVMAGTKDFLLANAWCAQSASTTLRYFLALSTDPIVKVRQII